MGERVRAFVAVELDARSRDAVVTLVRALGALGGDVRWSRPEQLHVTVKFLGETARVDEVGEIVAAVASRHAPFALRPAGVGSFPTHGRPRVVFVGAEERPPGALTALAADLEGALETIGIPRETRAFVPHVTLGRSRDPAGSRDLDLDAWGRWRIKDESETAELVLFRSDLQPGGARYTALRRFPLAAAVRS